MYNITKRLHFPKEMPIHMSTAKNEKMTDDIWIKTDINFGSDFPNSYLDISYPNCDNDSTRPTFVYWHGGGHNVGRTV